MCIRDRVLELDPKYTDAKLVVGAHNYVMGNLPLTVKIAVALVGLSGDKDKGLRYLNDAYHGNGETSVDAGIVLMAVSYTHLDVYKRQPFWEANPAPRFSSSGDIVSPVVLDVYDGDHRLGVMKNRLPVPSTQGLGTERVSASREILRFMRRWKPTLTSPKTRR